MLIMQKEPVEFKEIGFAACRAGCHPGSTKELCSIRQMNYNGLRKPGGSLPGLIIS
jgi:hypothetical protein